MSTNTVAALLGALLTTAAAAEEPIPLEHFFREVPVSQVRISPDGRYISALVRADALPEAVNIIVMPVTGGESRAITGYSVEDVIWHEWDGDRIVFQVTRGKDERTQRWRYAGIYSIKADGSGGREIYSARPSGDMYRTDSTKAGKFSSRASEDVGRYGLRISDSLPLVAGTMLAHGYGKRAYFPEAYRLNLSTGHFLRVASNHSNVLAWYADQSGRVRIGVDAGSNLEDMTSHLLYREDERADWRRVLDFPDGDVHVIGFDADNRHLWIAARMDRDREALFRMDPETGELGAPVAEDARYDVGSRLVRARDGQPLYLEYPADRTRKVWLDPTWRELGAELEAAIPDRTVDVVDSDDAERFYVLFAWSDRDPGTYYLFDRQELALRELLRTRPWIEPESMAEMRPIRFEARDGMAIEGYLSIPAGYGKPGPLVLHPHGGPYGVRDEWDFNDEVNALASRGYAVLQVNYRGSGGYGRGFESAGFRQWGRDMQNDLEDAVAWAIGNGWADRDRICIYGASYGGYATQMGLVRTPELFACGISYVGVADLALIHKEAMGTSRSAGEYRYYTLAGFSGLRGSWVQSRIGNPKEDSEYFRESSPIEHVERIRAPLLLVHGESDWRVPIEHHRRLTQALKAAGKTYEEIIEHYEGHGFVAAANRERLYESILAFLDKHIGAQPVDPAGPAGAAEN
jgi:dipeptidyl aminopeptidase/acylaminoacyl peptidase